MSKLTKGYDLVFELHFNGSSPQTNGVEALVYYSNRKMYKIGSLYCELMNKRLGLKNRKCKKMTSGKGFGFLSLMKGDAILLEPFFGSNHNDCVKYNDREHALIIEEIINEYEK